MNEQEQAQVLADWLAQPVTAPAPDGLDPDVVESVYAMQPDRAPMPTLTADDIFADFEAIGATETMAPDRVAGPVVVAPIPQTQVSAAPSWWRSANRVGGLGVLMATAATLLLVVLPTMQSDAPVATMSDDVAAAAAPPPQVLQEEVAQVVAPETVAMKKELPPAKQRVSGSRDVANNNTAPERLDMARGQSSSDSLIPEVAAAAEPLDAVAVADDGDYRDLNDETALSRQQAAAPAAPAAAEEEAESELEDAPAASTRSAAMPSDRSSAWRGGVDSATLASIDQALAIGQTEARSGQYGAAADAIREHVRPPAGAGQYIAAQAATWYLAAGNVQAAISTAQSGLGLSQENTAERSWLLVVYGDAQAAAGDPQGASAAYQQAATLNRAR